MYTNLCNMQIIAVVVVDYLYTIFLEYNIIYLYTHSYVHCKYEGQRKLFQASVLLFYVFVSLKLFCDFCIYFVVDCYILIRCTVETKPIYIRVA